MAGRLQPPHIKQTGGAEYRSLPHRRRCAGTPADLGKLHPPRLIAAASRCVQRPPTAPVVLLGCWRSATLHTLHTRAFIKMGL